MLWERKEAKVPPRVSLSLSLINDCKTASSGAPSGSRGELSLLPATLKHRLLNQFGFNANWIKLQCPGPTLPCLTANTREKRRRTIWTYSKSSFYFISPFIALGETCQKRRAFIGARGKPRAKRAPVIWQLFAGKIDQNQQDNLHPPAEMPEFVLNNVEMESKGIIFPQSRPHWFQPLKTRPSFVELWKNGALKNKNPKQIWILFT